MRKTLFASLGQPLSKRSFPFRVAEEEVDTENPVSMSPRLCLLLKMRKGRVLSLLTCLLRNRNPRKRERKERAAAADQPGQCRLESLNWLAGRRDQSEHEGTRPGATQGLFKQEVHARVRKMVRERCSRASAIPLPQAAFRELL